MKTRRWYLCVVRTLLINFLSLIVITINAQRVLCPPNFDFEYGNFSNWECRTGSVYSNGTDNVVTWNNFSQVNGRHTIIPASDLSMDPYGLFPKSCPNGSGFSILLGNDIGGAEAEGVFYTFSIPATANKFSIIYNYAVVLQTPNHLPPEQPRFRAKVIDLTTNSEISCVSFDFTSSPYLPGFLPSPVSNLVVYKDWTPISVDLSEYAGKTVRLEFITSDCTFTRHFGYAYIDVNSTCNGVISGSTLCGGETAITLTAPFGFQDYRWYSDNSFTNIISNTQRLVLDPAPSVGTIYPVIVTPYPTFGCEDTLYAEITTSPKPLSDAGPDKSGCSKQPVQIGVPGSAGYSYSWTPSILLINAAVSAPFTRPGLPNPVNFIVKTTDLTTGCYSYDTTTVTPFLVDTSSSMTGNSNYCPDEILNNTLQVNNKSSTVQWYQNNVAINGATNYSFSPQSSVTSSYWAQITENGCIDSTRQYPITFLPQPKVNFSVNSDFQCINSAIRFTNTTTISDNELLEYQWRFSDGTSSVVREPLKSFAAIGPVTAKLVVTSLNNCKDSLQKSITILPNCATYLPTAFTPNGDGLNDVIKPTLYGMKGVKQFTVYNRYGNIVFSTTRQGEGWDGTYKGTKLDSGVFVWILEYITNEDKVVFEKGTLTLIR